MGEPSISLINFVTGGLRRGRGKGSVKCHSPLMVYAPQG